MNDRLVTVATFLSPVEANLAKNELEAAGVKAYLLDEETANTAWQLTSAIGGVKLQVAEHAARQAATVLAHQPDTDFTDDDSPAVDAGPMSEMIATADIPRTLADEPERVLTAREQRAERAYRGAVFGMVFAPLHLLVFWVLLRVFLSDERLNADMRRKALIAFFINLPFMIGFCVFAALLLNAPLTSLSHFSGRIVPVAGASFLAW